ncbi:MAG: hypothetical protein NTZ16_16420 [Verrucomicrobia bacterium]|nr:hypothetical protein [Verrucomicrobiota bacterium]
MRIVNRLAFLQMPEGTVFTKYKPCVGDAPMVKHETIWHNEGKTAGDFYASDVLGAVPDSDSSGDAFDKFDAMEKDGTLELPVENAICRDGLFDEDQLFIVFSDADCLVHAKNITPTDHVILKKSVLIEVIKSMQPELTDAEIDAVLTMRT